jgi:hypothetical protein
MFHTYIVSVFIWVLHMFCKCFYFFQLFQIHVSSVSSVFRRMLQIFHPDVSKENQVLHTLQWRRWNIRPPRVVRLTLSSPVLSPLPSLPSISSQQFELGGKRRGHIRSCVCTGGVGKTSSPSIAEFERPGRIAWNKSGKMESRHGRPDARVRPDVRALALSINYKSF